MAADKEGKGVDLVLLQPSCFWLTCPHAPGPAAGGSLRNFVGFFIRVLLHLIGSAIVLLLSVPYSTGSWGSWLKQLKQAFNRAAGEPPGITIMQQHSSLLSVVPAIAGFLLNLRHPGMVAVQACSSWPAYPPNNMLQVHPC
jgi:hypothetical protein